MVDIINSLDENMYFYYDKCPPDFLEDNLGNCVPMGSGTRSIYDNVFPDPTPTPPDPPVPPTPPEPFDPIINPDLYEDEESYAPPLPPSKEETIIVPHEDVITIYSDDGDSLTITEAEAISAGIITSGGILVKTGTEAYNSYQAYLEGLAKRAGEEEGIELVEEEEARGLAEAEQEIMVEEEGTFEFMEGAETRYAFDETEIFETDPLIEEEGIELAEIGEETADLMIEEGEIFEGGEFAFEAGETGIELAEIGESTALLAEEGALATDLALESAALGSEIIGLEAIASIGAEASVVAPYVAPVIIVGTAIALLGYVLYSIFNKRKKKKKNKTETTYTEETINVPITYEEMVSVLNPDERRELLQAMKDNNENGQFDTSIDKLETGQKIILATYADGSQALTFPLNATQLEGLPKFLEQNPEYFYGQDELYLKSLGVNPQLADPNLAPSIIEDGNIYSVIGQQTFRFDEYEQTQIDQNVKLLGDWSAELTEADYLYANRMITLEQYNQMRDEALQQLKDTGISQAEQDKLLNVLDYQAGRISADEYIDNMRTNTYIYESPEWKAWLEIVKNLRELYDNGDITAEQYNTMIKTNKQAFIDAEPITLTDYEYERLTLDFQYGLGQLTYDEYMQALDYTYALEVSDYSQFSERLQETQDQVEEIIEEDADDDEVEQMRDELQNEPDEEKSTETTENSQSQNQNQASNEN